MLPVSMMSCIFGLLSTILQLPFMKLYKAEGCQGRARVSGRLMWQLIIGARTLAVMLAPCPKCQLRGNCVGGANAVKFIQVQVRGVWVVGIEAWWSGVRFSFLLATLFLQPGSKWIQGELNSHINWPYSAANTYNHGDVRRWYFTAFLLECSINQTGYPFQKPT